MSLAFRISIPIENRIDSIFTSPLNHDLAVTSSCNITPPSARMARMERVGRRRIGSKSSRKRGKAERKAESAPRRGAAQRPRDMSREIT
jgi:hypothetical protein